MEIEYQNTKADYLDFYKSHFAEQLKKRVIGLIILPLLVAFIVGGQPFKWPAFFIAFFVMLAVLLLIGYILPYLIATIKLKKEISKENIYLEKRKLSTSDTGILIQSASKTTQWNWQSINSFSSNENYIQIQLVDKKVFLLPKRFFASENDVVNFLGIVQTEINKGRVGLNKISGTIGTVNKPR